MHIQKNVGLYIFTLCLLFSQLGVVGQTLSIEGFSIIPFDLSSRTSSITDNNGTPCALVKIVCNDEITGIQGNVIRTEENGNEYWVYLSCGTKHVKILSRHHAPLDLSISDYFKNGVSSQSTYQLDLRSGLPPEILYGSKNPLASIAMSKEGEPLLPKWWNLHENGMYVGISPSSIFDGDAAKHIAITNALYSFIHSRGCEITYKAEIDLVSEDQEETATYKVSCIGLKKGFTVDIIQEYYNSNGEYFVLCKIRDGSNPSSELQFNWAFNDKNLNGNITVNAEVITKINRYPFDSKIQYELSWTPDSDNMVLISNGKTIVDHNTNLRDNDDIADFKLCGDLGTSQLRLLTSIPIFTDSVNISETSKITGTYDSKFHRSKELFSISKLISGIGHSLSRDIRLYDYSNRKLTFGVSECFPDLVFRMPVDISSISQRTGLSENYNRYYEDENGVETAIVSKSLCQNGVFEASKNISLLHTMLLSIIPQNIPMEVNLKENKSFTERNTKATLYPLLFLDPEERVACNVNKYRKEWKKNRKNFERTAAIIIPIESSNNNRTSLINAYSTNHLDLN